jgi:signal transduction histidine kinase
VGRLFWKFFLFTWIAQLAGIVAFVSVFWLTEPAHINGEVAGPSVGGPPLDGAPGSPHWPPNGPLIGTLLASLLTAALLARYVAKPIRSLRVAFEAASSGHLDYRVAPVIGTRRDELADLGREFDRMAERLADSMGRQKRLLHDVSHEVRSPLARLQAAIGLARLKGSTDEATFERIEEEIARIDRLVGDLLRLSRIEAGEIAEDLEEVDLRELVSHVVSDANFEVQTAGRQVIWTKQASAAVMGRPEMLHVAFENIVRNAIKHAPSSPVVTIETSVDAANSRYVFLVLDTGPGVPEDEVAALFTPFFRSTHALSTDGYGLGLAIASRSIQAHGGTIHAQNRTTGGLSVEITLPLAGLQTSDSSGALYRVGG